MFPPAIEAGPASIANVLPGDVIVRLDGREVFGRTSALAHGRGDAG